MPAVRPLSLCTRLATLLLFAVACQQRPGAQTPTTSNDARARQLAADSMLHNDWANMTRYRAANA